MSASDKDRIRIELGCPIFIEINEQRKKLSSKIVGLEHKDYIIIRSPGGLEGVLGKLNPGKIFVVKYVHRGVAYGFKTHVLSAITSPAHLMFIDYPKSVVEQSLRAENRYKCFLACNVRAIGIDSPGTVVDISLGGCCFTLPASSQGYNQSLAVGTEIELKLKKSESEAMIKIKGSVTNLVENDTVARVGVIFKDVEAKIKSELKEIIFPLYMI